MSGWRLFSKQCIAASNARILPVVTLNHPKILSFTTQPIVKQPRSQRNMSGIGGMGYLLLMIPVITFGLGTWQVRRRRWKLNMIAMLEEKTKSEPIEFPNDLNELAGLEYCRVTVRGRFQHDREMYLGPRSLVEADDHQQHGFLPGKSGYLVVTPFELADRDLTILVNRGWVPRKLTCPSTRPEGQVTDEVTLIGVVRHQDKRLPFSSKNCKNKEQSTLFHFRDLVKMAEMGGAAKIYIDADAASTVAGGPTGGQTVVTLRNEHLSYIFTWYTLSLATSFMWYKRYYKRYIKK